MFGRPWAGKGNIPKALEQAFRTHKSQKRDDGVGYLEQHIYPVVCDALVYLQDESVRETLIIVTLLHDVLEEDPTISVQNLLDEYGKDVALLLSELQKIRKDKPLRTQEDRHDEHLTFGERLKKAPYICKVVKTLDRINNIECTEGKINPIKYRRFVQDTEDVYLPLAMQVDVQLAKRMAKGIDRVKEELQAINIQSVD